MNKAIVMLSMVLFSGCIAVYDNPDATKGKGIDVPRANSFQYQGHSYIFFKSGLPPYGASGVVHDPDCVCQLNNNHKYNK